MATKKKSKPVASTQAPARKKSGGHRGAASAPSPQAPKPTFRWVMVLDEKFHRKMVREELTRHDGK